jgi:hypothetical protein
MFIGTKSRAKLGGLAMLATFAMATPAFAASARHGAHHQRAVPRPVVRPGYGFDPSPVLQPGWADPHGDSSVCIGSFGRRMPCNVPGA